MLILGIDPGTGRTGYGLVRIESGQSPILVSCGCIETDKDMLPHERLKDLFLQLGTLIKEHKPDVMAVEKLFFNRNITTAMGVCEARGVILLAASLESVPIFEYTPIQVKEALTGYGRASKAEVKEMVKIHLSVDRIKGPDDVSDALAIAVCHSFSYEFAGDLND